MTFWLLALTALAEILMPQLMGLLLIGSAHDAAHLSLVVDLARITFPYMPLICLTALLSGVLNGLDKFAAAAAAPVVYNLTSMAFMVARKSSPPGNARTYQPMCLRAVRTPL